MNFKCYVDYGPAENSRRRLKDLLLSNTFGREECANKRFGTSVENKPVKEVDNNKTYKTNGDIVFSIKEYT